MNKLFLRLVAFFNPVFERSGVNTAQLQLILATKLLIDKRRPSAMFHAKRKQKTQSSQGWGVMLFSLMMGLFYGLVLFAFKQPMMGQTMYFSIFMVLMALTLITDFTNVLVDTRDQFIIIPRPVDGRTIAMARILHVTVYLLRQALTMGLPALVMITFIDGALAVPVFLVQLLLATLLSVFLVNMVYLLLLNTVSPQRFKDIISYVQIAFSIVIFAAYYLIPRLIDINALQQSNFLQNPATYALPPVWIAAISEAIIHPGRMGYLSSLLAIVGLTMPLLSIWVVAKYLAPGFNRRLAIIATADSSPAQTQLKTSNQRQSFIDTLAKYIAPKGLQNAGFKITAKLSARTREFKMKVYPAFAYVPVYFIYFALTGSTKHHQSLTESYISLQNTKSYIFLLYMCSLVLISLLGFVTQTEKFKSAWVYYAAPVKAPGGIIAGMYKAVVTLYFFPYTLFVSIISVLVWGPAIINDALLAFFLLLSYGLILSLFVAKGLPFSLPVQYKRGSSTAIVRIVLTLMAGAIGFCHYLILRWEWLVWSLIPVAAITYVALFYWYSKQTWDELEQGALID